MQVANPLSVYIGAAAADTMDNRNHGGEQAPVIVVGAGPVGLRFVEELSALDPATPIKLFTGEAFKPYDRVKLSQLLARDIIEQEIYFSPFALGQNIYLHENCPVTSIDRVPRRVWDSEGNYHYYSRLVLALGSSPFVPNIPNIDIRNVFTFRDLKDTQALFARNIGSRHTVILGGGLLGLETARAMLRNNTRVTVIQLGKHLMDRQLDAGAGKLLEAAVTRLGIDVICSSRVTEILADANSHNTSRSRVAGVRLDDGREIPCDTVIVSAGIRPRTELAMAHGLAFDKGIRVNEHLQTSDPHIYAIGECAQFGDQVYGLVAPGYEQALVAAHHIHRGEAAYRGTISATSLKVVGEKVFSVGEINPETGRSIRPIVYKSRTKKIYRAIFTINDRLVGALALGDWPEQNRIRNSIAENRKVWLWNQWFFRLTGFIWQNRVPEDISTWPANMVVCNCTGTTRQQLTAARSAGACSVDALAGATRASTVCGSCRPLLAGFCGESQAADAGLSDTPDLAWLKYTAATALLLLVAALVAGPVPFLSTVQGLRYDLLWLDGFAKQVTGFTLLGLASLSLLMSLNKRLRWFRIGKFTSWRLFHAVLGSLALVILIVHTGINLGMNLNRWLMVDFLLIVLLGTVAALVISRETLFSARTGKRLRGMLTWAHTLVFWPLPVLLTFHVLSVYYF